MYEVISVMLTNSIGNTMDLKTEGLVPIVVTTPRHHEYGESIEAKQIGWGSFTFLMEQVAAFGQRFTCNGFSADENGLSLKGSSVSWLYDVDGAYTFEVGLQNADGVKGLPHYKAMQRIEKFFAEKEAVSRKDQLLFEEGYLKRLGLFMQSKTAGKARRTPQQKKAWPALWAEFGEYTDLELFEKIQSTRNTIENLKKAAV